MDSETNTVIEPKNPKNDEKSVQKKKIFRFEFTRDIMDMIKQFSLIHQYDDRKIYKELWNNWFQEHKEMMEREIMRMTESGYEGDVQDKMFKAGRYYFRKKNIKSEQKNTVSNTGSNTEQESKNTNDKQKGRNYISMDQTTLEAMDSHIKKQLETNGEFTPASGFNNFCMIFTAIIRTEVNRMVTENQMNTTEISGKIKKTYKNRYYIITRN